MLYFAVPIVGGVFDFPAGSILRRAYQHGDSMRCEFERIATIGDGWKEISAEVFNADYIEIQDGESA